MSPSPIAVWRSSLLSRSDAFVESQSESLTRYRPHYFGSTHLHDVPLPTGRTFVSQDPVLAVTGRSPAFARQLRERRIELLHTHFGTEAWRALQVGRGVPTVVTFHRSDVATDDAIPHRRQVFKRAALCIAVSDYVARRLVELGCPPDRVVVHRVGVDTESLRPDDRNQREPGLLVVGDLIEHTGIVPLFKALTLIRSRMGWLPPVTIVGDGPQRELLDTMVRRLRLDVTFSSSDDLRLLMHRKTALVVPTQDVEPDGLPLLLREAQASGLPVVTTRTAEVISDDIDGLVVPERDPNALTRALERLLGDVDLRKLLQYNAFATVQSVNLSVQAAGLEALYDDALDRH